MNEEELKQLLHKQNEGVLSTNIPEVINSVMTLYEKGVEVGIEIGKQISISKTCEWIEKTFFDICDLSKRSDYIEVACKHKTKHDLIENFKRAMEE